MNTFAFSESYSNPAGSPIRELFPYLSQPGIVSFAGGYPSPSLFDSEGLQAAAQQAMAQVASTLQYGATEGSPVLREQLVQLCQTRGIQRNPSDVLVTTGSQQGFDLLVRVFIEPGDTVFVETPAYPAATQALRLAKARIQEVPVDAHGLQVEVLEQLLKKAAPKDRPKFLYTVPTFSNPSGVLLSQVRRERLLVLAAEYQFLVVEDDPYGELTFAEHMPATIFATGDRLLGEHNPVIYLSSLSKTVAPALRIGWMIAPQEVLRRCAIAKQTVDLCTSPLNQAVAAAYLGSGRYPASVALARKQYKARMRAMVDALNEKLGDRLTFVEPQGGMFLWAENRHQIDPKRLFQEAVKQGVLYVPGAAFYPNQPNTQTMRLSYAAPGVDDILLGIDRLQKAFQVSQ